jgi:hypothetical protein
MTRTCWAKQGIATAMEVAIKKRALRMRETPSVLIDPTSPIGCEIDLSRVKGKEA